MERANLDHSKPCGTRPESCSGKSLPQSPPELGNIVLGVFTPVLAKHTKSFNLVDTLSGGVDRIQRNFEPLHRQVELWRKTQITDDAARLIFYSAFIDGKLEAPCCPKSTGCISSRNILSSRPQPWGACRMPLPAPSRSLILCRSSKRPQRWGAFSRTTAQLIRDLRLRCGIGKIML